MELIEMLEQYLSLSAILESKGGRESVSGDSDLESLHDKLSNLEDNILQKFGLPSTMKFKVVLIDFTMLKNARIEIPHVINLLSKEANEYLKSTPTERYKILKEAKVDDLKTYEVFPEIGIKDNIYSMFILEEIYKKDKCTAEELLRILKTIDERTFQNLGRLHYNIYNKVIKPETEMLFRELFTKQIKYLNEFTKFVPTYPY